MTALVEPLARLLERAPESWREVIETWRQSPAGQALVSAIDARQRARATVYPAAVLRAFELTPRDRVRVVIVGQDPYHGPGQAEGLAFSVPAGQRVPPSLRNLFKELQRDLGVAVPAHGHLGAWAHQGVLLLNSVLTVEQSRPGSHGKLGWEVLTDAVIAAVALDSSPRVFMLWGSHAQSKTMLIGPQARHLVLASSHPSPLSATRGRAPFVGNGHFGATNRYFESQGLPPIEWQLG